MSFFILTSFRYIIISLNPNNTRQITQSHFTNDYNVYERMTDPDCVPIKWRELTNHHGFQPIGVQRQFDQRWSGLCLVIAGHRNLNDDHTQPKIPTSEIYNLNNQLFGPGQNSYRPTDQPTSEWGSCQKREWKTRIIIITISVKRKKNITGHLNPKMDIQFYLCIIQDTYALSSVYG